MQVSNSPPKAPPVKYAAHMGTRWQKELEAAGGLGAFEHPDDPKFIGPWIIGECVGKGASGRVKIAKHKRTGQLAAVKILPLQPLVNSRASLATQQAKSHKQRLGIDREITMMKLMDHPNIMRIYDVYEGGKELYLVLEYVEGGELFDFLVNRGRLHPLEALAYFKQLVYGLNYAHTFSIIHRDLKPENILIHSLNPPLIKIADWGMAAFAPPALQLETSCGSPHYASPEIVNGEKYEGNATDIWSCGVILYALLTGRLPFDDKNVRTLLEKVKAGKYDMPPYIDPQARDLLSRMLIVDVAKRMTIPEILSHPWLSLPTPGPPPTLPPPPTRLARPLRSASHIDMDLLESLRIIWGRHADVSAIKAELLAPPGEGTLAKAFYFLLERYRERVEGGDVEDVGDQWRESLFDGRLLGGKPSTITKQYTALMNNSSTGQSERQKEVPRSIRLSPAPPPRSYNPARSHLIPRGGPPIPSDIRVETKLQRPSSVLTPPVMLKHPSSISSNSRSRPPSPLGPRPARGRPVSHDGLRGPHLSPGHDLAYPPIQMQAQAPIYTNVHMRRDMLMTDSPMEMDVSSVQFPVGSEYEHETRVSASPVQVHTDTSAVIHAPVPIHIMAQPLPMLTAPRTENVELQRAINDITDRVNVLVVRQNQGDGRDGGVQDDARWFDGPHGFVSVEAPSSNGSGRGRIEEGCGGRDKDQDKENRYRREDDKKNKNGNGGKGLKKERKSRPLTLDLHAIPMNPKRSTLSILGSPTLMSPPALFSPVGEFKGWFSNLFNWKPQPPCVLYSPADISATRNETVRLLEQLGVVVALEEGLLRCRLDDSVDGSGGGGQKRAWFKVELVGTGVGSGPLPTPRLLALSPNPNASTSPNSISDVSPNPNFHSHFNNGAGGARSSVLPVAYVPGSACAIVLAQEKGSVATFKSVCRRVKEEWRVGEAGLVAPTPVPALGLGVGMPGGAEHVQRFSA